MKVSPTKKSDDDATLEVTEADVKHEFTIPTIERTEVFSPDATCTEDITTPESSLTNLIRDMKNDVKMEKEAGGVDGATLLETEEFLDPNSKDIDHLIIEEESLEPVMCGNNNVGLQVHCKTLSPAPSNNEEFEIPEIYDDVISTIYSDPPVFDKK